jgi:hypothetical protein
MKPAAVDALLTLLPHPTPYSPPPKTYLATRSRKLV